MGCESHAPPLATATSVGVAVAMHGITKRFPGVVANDGVDFEVAVGEVHALLGENGAGKSTLSNILTGLYRPDEGEIVLYGDRVEFATPRDALDAGIGMVHQHFRLVTPFTVAENIALGEHRAGQRASFLIDPRRIESGVRELSERYGIAVDPRARIWQLSLGEQQRVEILKALYRDARVLILDEPTAVLTPQEAQVLFGTMRQMADDGRTVIFISHKLNEVTAVSDRVTVLRGGKSVATASTAESTPRSLASLMVGREVGEAERKPRAEPTGPMLELDDIWAAGSRGEDAVRGVSLSVRAGEIVAVAGVAGNGQRELRRDDLRPARSVEGDDHRCGQVGPGRRSAFRHERRDRLHPRGQARHGRRPRAEHRVEPRAPLLPRLAGLARPVPDARQDPHAGCRADRALPDRGARPGHAGTRALRRESAEGSDRAREFSGSPRVVIASSPTQGLDVGATETVRSYLLEAAAGGAAVLVFSEDLDEILELADRIAVIYEGTIAGEVPASKADVEEIGLMMAGAVTARETGSAEHPPRG